MAELFFQISLLFIVAAIAASIAKMFKQPLIPAYIVAGIILGPILHLITDPEVISTLSEIGIAFLLFIVGLELDFKRLKDVGSVAVLGGSLQLIILYGITFLVSLLLGFSIMESSYLGFVVGFASTMVVISILADRNELDTLHGKIVIGILLLQDIIAVFALTFYGSLGSFDPATFIMKILSGVGLFGLAMLLSKYLLPSLFRLIARSRELLFLISLAMIFGFAILFSYVGFSLVIGAFVAGIMLGNLPYNIEIVSRVVSLKDFFGVLFFVGMGTELVTVNFNKIIGPLLSLTILQLVLTPLVTILILSFWGYKRRTSLLTGMGLSQVSEFSLILVSSGLALGHIDVNVFSITILMFIITVVVTSYFLKFEIVIYNKISPFLKPFEKLSKKNKEIHNVKQEGHEVILVGLDRIGDSLFRTLRKMHKDVVVVDFNPEIIKKLDEEKVPCMYGDVGDLELLHKLKIKQSSLLISTVPEFSQTKLLINTAKKQNPNINIIVTAYTVQDAIKLYEEGAHYVILPHLLGGDHVSIMLEDISDDLDKLIMHKINHIKELKRRKDLHPHHM